jgi:hypothetical protein
MHLKTWEWAATEIRWAIGWLHSRIKLGLPLVRHAELNSKQLLD